MSLKSIRKLCNIYYILMVINDLILRVGTKTKNKPVLEHKLIIIILRMILISNPILSFQKSLLSIVFSFSCLRNYKLKVVYKSKLKEKKQSKYPNNEPEHVKSKWFQFL